MTRNVFPKYNSLIGSEVYAILNFYLKDGQTDRHCSTTWWFFGDIHLVEPREGVDNWLFITLVLKVL